MADAAFAGDKAAAPRHIRRRIAATGAREDFLHQTVGAGKPHEALDTAQRGLLRGAFGHRHATPGDSADDVVESAMVVDLPAKGSDVLGRTALQQKSTFVVVEPESHDVTQRLVEMHADGVAAEP